ncbi:hypothetical protein [Mammaliicoccus stepanovicii]|uniref:Uncharacterized protein n=1 Tax=Mammaliicoccus stepanovicii TaxID=643214 RepID=A0A239ZUG2_9STAP|nr:hypothetical protein [Mammaliicoccus stepanovicii]PNZ77439.1 hypothetical protein CD111_04530 [Mammaliicoccus stepanovicii]GGI39025.1 hypothetical protein GCM10010896_01320 [Mammaliicoccus stepanovicii]SNV74892.1 Uncharacterised protein [Mammaliicoccus stepanovicii]
MERYEQFAFIGSVICAFILLLNLAGVIHLSSLLNTVITAGAIAGIATYNIRKYRFVGIILYVICICMITLYLLSI